MGGETPLLCWASLATGSGKLPGPFARGTRVQDA